MDFYDITTREWTRSTSKDYTITPTFIYGGKDIVCKGGEMYAFWYNDIWNTDRNYLIDVIDSKVAEKYKQIKELYPEKRIETSYMKYHDSNVMKSFMEFARQMPESDVQFNSKIIFSDRQIKREDYATEQLSYTPTPGDTPAFDEMFKKLYDEDELIKIMWFIGAVLTNSMKKIEKFLFLYGGKGTGKGTILSVFKKLFEGYYAPIDLHRLTSGSEFATGGIKETPLLIDDDADLYSIKDDTNLLKLTSHDPIQVNNKYQSTYSITFDGLLVAASNQPYKVRNIDSGITRRAVVAKPTNETHDYDTYHELMKKIDFELAHIAQKAIDIFESMGPGAYEDYVDYSMMEATDHFYDFMRENAVALGEQTTLKQASELYRLYLEDINYDTRGYKLKAKQGLMRYYMEYDERRLIDGERIRNVFTGLKWGVIFPKGIDNPMFEKPKEATLIVDDFGLAERESILDTFAKTYPAQYTNHTGTPKKKWDEVDTTLADIDTSELHYVMLPLNHIVIDLDITNEKGEKDLVLNLEKVKELGLPETYMETSKSGQGIHLHYIYEGEPNKLNNLIEEDVEIKVFKGKSSLRRKLTLCNDKEIASIVTGLPMKEEDRVYKDIEMISWDEKKMRNLIKGNLQRKYHANTKPSVDFIVKIFDDAEQAGTKYDLKDMRQDILAFAASSTNQAPYCMKAVSGINFSTLEPEYASDIQKGSGPQFYKDEELYFYDVEVFSNLFIFAYKKYGVPDSEAVALINPTQAQIENVIDRPLVGFNNRRYDNHIVYAALLGEDNQSLFRQSQRIINDKDASSGMYSGAYELSYTDIYDYSNAGNKKSLKKWEVELGIKHDEFELPWDKPVPEDMWERAAEYCINDVIATEAVFEATRADYNARRILSTLSGLSMNASTNQHTTAIIFEGKPKFQTQKELVYTDLSKDFPGYSYSFGKSTYRGEEPGEGGYVYVEPGVYKNVSLFDVESMHPTSAIELNAFGKYTKNFKDILDARLAIKHGDYEEARKLFNGRLKPYLNDEEEAGDLSNALKTAINSVYGLTSASFDNAFRHPKNQDNIVAKRGALFMIDLKLALQERGVKVIHIKTDSVKVIDPSPEDNQFILDFAKQYGYNFELEDVYKRFAIVNKSTYVCENEDGVWDAVGAQYKEPFVFKMLFSKEELTREDFFQTKQVRNASLYLGEEFVGSLAEVYASQTGEDVWRVTDDKKGYVSGTKGFKWRLSTDWLGKEDVDMLYYKGLINKAIKNIEQVGDVSIMIEDWEGLSQEV